MLLDNYPDTLALIQMRYGCVGSTPWGDARFAFYGETATPAVMFDGSNNCAGSLANLAAQYDWYHTQYLAQVAVPTNVTIALTGYPRFAETYRVGARVCLELGEPARPMRVYMAQVLDWGPVDPNDPPYSRNKFRHELGTEDITLYPGQCQTVFKDITFDSLSWAHQGSIKIIAWAQEPQDTGLPADRAVVFQAATMAWPFPADCNANGIPDFEDIGSGFSQDVNTNGIPDECELIEAGIDLWTTPTGGTTYFHEWSPPVPPGFFGPGSDPFDGQIVLHGQPLVTNPPNLFGPADTVVERMDDANVLTIPSQDTVPIEIRALSLVSLTPITVTYGGGGAELWDVKVCLSDMFQPVGSMTLYHDCPDGGTYDATLPVLPKFIFTRVPDEEQRVLDFGLDGRLPITLLAEGAEWVRQPDPKFGLIGALPGTRVDSNCDGLFDAPLPGTSPNFAAGIWPLPCEAGTAPGESEQFKRLMQLSAAHAAQGLIAAQVFGGDSDADGIADDADNCPEVGNPLQEDTDWDTVGDACDNCPLLYNPYQEDCDADGMGDVCAIASGHSQDCNQNGIPDECDIAGGTSLDVNGNGVPDECEFCRGDCNCDGSINWRDIDYFVAAMTSHTAWEAMFLPGSPSCQYDNCDVNISGAVNWRDIDPFVAVMNTACP